MNGWLPDPQHSWYAQAMDAYIFAHRTASLALIIATTTLSGALALGCNQGDAKADNTPSNPDTAVAPAAAPERIPQTESPAAELTVLGGQSEYKEAAFTLVISPPKAVKAGAPLEFTIILAAQGEYKVNQEYPIKFQFAEEKGVTPQKKVVSKVDAKVEKAKATMPLLLTIQSPGKHNISGKLSFSVCTDERCLIEKRELKLEVDAF
jgi:hypothetical protein